MPSRVDSLGGNLVKSCLVKTINAQRFASNMLFLLTVYIQVNFVDVDCDFMKVTDNTYHANIQLF